MSTTRSGAPGATRVCPHCRVTILESAAICPACRHHLRFDPAGAQQSQTTSSPLLVEGTIRHPGQDAPWEYSVTLTIRNDKGEELARKVVGVGALQGSEERTFTLEVEVAVPEAGSRP